MNENLSRALANIEKNFGKGSVISFEEGCDNTIKRVSTGSLGLDLAIGGGYPYGRIVEIYGPESSGKSTTCIHAIAAVQANNGVVAYVDTEHAFDPDYAQNLGVDLSKENFIFAQPDSGEQALSIVEELVKSKEVSMIIVDSVAALTPQAELDGDFGESKMGLHARLMSQAMRKLVGIVHGSNCIVIFVNQLREKIGVMFGSPECTTGGNALKFYASIRLDIRRTSTEKDGDISTGNRVKVKVVKNKTYPPFKTCEFSIVFGEGISLEGEIVDIGSEMGIIKKGGSWYSYEDTKLGQGRDNVIALLKDNVELREILREKILANI